MCSPPLKLSLVLPCVRFHPLTLPLVRPLSLSRLPTLPLSRPLPPRLPALSLPRALALALSPLLALFLVCLFVRALSPYLSFTRVRRAVPRS